MDIKIIPQIPGKSKYSLTLIITVDIISAVADL